MNWAEALQEVSTLQSAPAPVEIARVEYDSRRVGPAAAFVAMRGGTTDGNRYIDGAIAKGAAAIVTDSAEVYARLRREHPELAAAQVQYGRRALAELSAAVLGHPERRLKVTAVTGTNGKTTTAYLLEQLLRSAGRSCVLLGTIETHVGEEVRPSEHTTPEASDVLRTFADGIAAGTTEAVMEMSSHALDQERVWGIPVDVAIFTNLTQDHLDYHGTMENYAAAKARLFAGVGAAPPRMAVVNADDPAAERMLAAFRGTTSMTFGVDNPNAAFRAVEIRDDAHGTDFSFDTPDGRVVIHSPLFGRINVSNLLAALCAALARGVSLDELAALVPQLHSAPGRFQVVPGSAKAGFTVVVDYAHTEDALRNLIAQARTHVGAGVRIITLFGCGGDRDRSKRPRMGKAAAEGSDLVVLTSDNPRSEDPLAILQEALAGVRETTTEYIVEPDRSAAIRLAIHSARPGDIVLLAGKGHEKVQIVGHTTLPFDDVAVAAEILRGVR